MRFAVPVQAGRLTTHFGHAEAFAFIDADPDTHQIIKTETAAAPEHQPGLLPKWLHGQGANVVIAGGMGISAQRLLEQSGIAVVIGANSLDAASLVRAYLDRTLVTGNNRCDH